MPRGDGTGPAGAGQMTGRAAGYCAGYNMPGFANPIAGRGFGRGMGRGFGRGMSWGRGRGFGRWGYVQDPYLVQELKPEQELEMLQDQSKALQDEINLVNQRIASIEKASGKNK